MATEPNTDTARKFRVRVHRDLSTLEEQGAVTYQTISCICYFARRPWGHLHRGVSLLTSSPDTGIQQFQYSLSRWKNFYMTKKAS
ncbi:hypothetical protein NDU88_001111 [Pleurodeles waltl]|uniref:Uncharacterized protein n=1 Tax=Pleurodeles waltl TaxID=8319 RepID=A0AAV7V9G3_PLEWA|nr:hypothetical protein NDU88_001111 [Pleurodeles waltl]